MDTIVTPVTVITLDSTRIVHSIKADLVARYFPPVVRLVQYDMSLPVIAVSLMHNGQTYTLPSGAAANIRVHKPDATYVYNPALGCDSTRNIVYFEVTQAMAAANGDGLAIVEIVVNGDIAGTSLITLHFEENPVPEDAIESSDEWETIYELGERIIASTVTPVSTAAGMTDHNVVYLYTGTESGWNQGHMYYYNGTTWVDAGIAVTDTTLSVAGLAADAKKTGDEIADLKDGLQEVQTEIIATLITDTASGSIASFSDGADNVPVKSLTVDIEPVQSGSGDPSPTNIRPISGHTQATVTRTGKNLFDCDNPNLLGAYISISGVITATEVDKSAYLYIGKNRDYAISFTQIALSSAREPDDVQVGLFTSEPVIGLTGTRVYKVSRPTATGNFSFQYTGNSGDNEWLMLKVGNTSWSNVSASMETIQIELNSAVTTYNAYNSQTVTIDLDGTRYGGTLNVETGVLTVDRAFIASYNGETLPSTWISDRDVYAAGTTPTTGAQVCYKLATPQTVQLTANEVSTVLGQNNVWNDCGDTTVEYRADTKLYINKMLNA